MTREDGPDTEASPLARLSEQVTRRLQAGDPIEGDDLLDRNPSCSGPIRSLLPTLRDLAALGRASPRSHRARALRPSDPSGSE